MHALSGYVDGGSVVTNENISSYEGYNVIITILDSMRRGHSATDVDAERRKEAARELAGLWKSHDDSCSVEEAVRAMRRGRSFDI